MTSKHKKLVGQWMAELGILTHGKLRAQTQTSPFSGNTRVFVTVPTDGETTNPRYEDLEARARRLGFSVRVDWPITVASSCDPPPQMTVPYTTEEQDRVFLAGG